MGLLFNIVQQATPFWRHYFVQKRRKKPIVDLKISIVGKPFNIFEPSYAIGFAKDHSLMIWKDRQSWMKKLMPFI